MADIIAIFNRWAKSGLSTFVDLSKRGRLSSPLDGSSSSSSIEPTRRGALDDIRRIMRLLPRIEAVLEDAEEREIQNRSVKLWLSELRLLAYDIDDVIDEYDYDLLATKMDAKAATEESCHHGERKRGDDEHHDEIEKREGRNISTSSSSQVPEISDDMVKKLREIRERFDEIERDRNVLHLREEDGVRRAINAHNPRLTSSLVDESSIIGRESEKEEILKLLLSDLESDGNIPISNKITVIPIVGMGGIGKTTLAQLIYNDPRIDKYFDIRKWIFVSEDFDLVKLTKNIYTSITNKSCRDDVGFDYLQDSIKKELMKFKKFFLVLDDVWNEKQCLWESLKVPFHDACTVNILLTTRNEKVANVMRTMNSFRLGFLSKDEGLQFFKQCASCDDKNLMEIGKKIVNKCGGLPLAIKLLGSHLRFERDEDKWMSILESDLLDLDPASSEILPVLRLSYERMPSHLKPCFRYCSIFPKAMMPDKNRVVRLWMAQGYIPSKITGKTMEEIGREYFDELLGRSFFQAEKEIIKSFRMHDLIFDLAVYISGNEFLTIKLESGNQNISISNNVRHIALHYEYSTNNEALEDTLVYPLLSRQVALRSLFYYGQSMIDDFKLLDSMSLRAVRIKTYQDEDPNILQFLGSIATTKHLRYLCIGGYYFEKALSSLVNSLHNFYNLQVLDLFNCELPIMLPPTSIRNLINLRHLLLPFDSYMPCGIGKLTYLQTLKYVQVMKDGSLECGGLGEIEDLTSLTGSCCIAGIMYAPDVDCFKKANITRKENIWRLVIDWTECYFWDFYSKSVDVCINFVKNGKEKPKIELAHAILEVLRPQKNLKELEILHYPGIQFPLWLRSLHGLEKLEIKKCYNLLISLEEILPSKLQYVCFEDCWKLTSITGLLNLHSLENLTLKRCPKLKLSFEEKLSSMPRVLEIIDCPGLEEWCKRYGFRHIQELSKKDKLVIQHSKDIISYYGSKNLISLQSLHIYGSNESDFPEVEWIPCSLHTLHLNSCQSLMFFPPYQNLSTLRQLKIWNCTALKCLPGLKMMKSLEKLEIIDCSQVVLSPNDSLPPKLQFLVIRNCPSILCLPALEHLLSLKNLKLFECHELVLPPPEELPFMLHVQLELFNSPKLIDWCQRYNIRYTKKESPKELIFVRSSEQIKLWLEDAYIFFENICVLDYDGAILEKKKWLAFQTMGCYICSCVHLKSIEFYSTFTRLKQLRIWDCSQLKELLGLYFVTTLQDMDISNCPKLCFLDIIPNSLQYLAIDRCNILCAVTCMMTSNISSIEISSCSNMCSIHGLQKQASLHFLKIYNCPQLDLRHVLLPDTLNPNNVEISACPLLQEWCQKQDVAYYTEEG